MPTASKPFAETFDELRAILKPYAGELLVMTDKPGEYTLGMRTAKDRVGRPLFAASVRAGKAYVSYHLMGVYGAPDLLKGISPELRKRMQGKSCFNFKSIEPDRVRELSALTKKSLDRMKTFKLPWA